MREDFGTTAAGTRVDRYTLTGGGMRVRVLTYGCVVQTLEVPDAAGRLGNVVLGRPDLPGYLVWSRYFGAVVGRYGNRIAGGRFTLDGAEHRLARNNGANSLHGGDVGFDRRVWRVVDAAPDRLALAYRSSDGEEGYPGALDVTVTYTAGDGGLRIDYRATTDAPTVVNLTNHSYFNLAGEGSGDVYGHRLWLRAGRFLPVREGMIPTGELAPVAGTPFDFTRPREIGLRISEDHPQLKIADGGYDHCFVLDDGTDLSRPAARVTEPASGRVLEVFTTEPGLQFYTGHRLESGHAGTGGAPYGPGAGLCLETQHFPDSPNRPGFPSTVLRPGRQYASSTLYRFSVAE